MISKYDLFVQCGRLLPDEVYLKLFYYIRMGKPLDLKNPVTFNEKLQWLKLHDRRPEYTVMVDKYAVKEYVAKRIGAEYVIPTLGVWDRFEDIDFSALPEQFVLKCTHDSGGIVIVRDKARLDTEAAKRKLNKCLRRNYYYTGREYAYKHVPPRILAEAYMEDSESRELRDYKFFCFQGRVKCFRVDYDRFTEHHANFYDPAGNLLEFGMEAFPPQKDKVISLPRQLDRMIELAEQLSCGCPFLRVDFYDVDGSIYFGELTFYSGAGFNKFTSDDADRMLGQWIEIETSF